MSFAQIQWPLGTFSYNGEDVKIMIDTNKMRKTSKYIQAWILHNYSSLQKDGEFRSILYLNQYDCNMFRTRTLSIKKYKDFMAKGESNWSYDYKDKDIKWHYPEPNSSIETISQAICALSKTFAK